MRPLHLRLQTSSSGGAFDLNASVQLRPFGAADAGAPASHFEDHARAFASARKAKDAAAAEASAAAAAALLSEFSRRAGREAVDDDALDALQRDAADELEHLGTQVKSLATAMDAGAALEARAVMEVRAAEAALERLAGLAAQATALAAKVGDDPAGDAERFRSEARRIVAAATQQLRGQLNAAMQAREAGLTVALASVNSMLQALE
jgi:hypothetical protein